MCRSTIRNCFLKAGFTPPAPEADDASDLDTVTEDEETEFIDNETQCLQKQATDANLMGDETTLEDHVSIDNDLLVTEAVIDDSIVRKVQMSYSVDNDTSDDDEDVFPSVSYATACDVIDASEDFVVDATSLHSL